MEYSIKIEEELARIINIEADSEDEAIALIEEMYNNEKIILDSSDFAGHVMFTKVKYNKIYEKN
jgi:uncharacterized membrane protein